jgi:hypothetical protein
LARTSSSYVEWMICSKANNMPCAERCCQYHTLTCSCSCRNSGYVHQAVQENSHRALVFTTLWQLQQRRPPGRGRLPPGLVPAAAEPRSWRRSLGHHWGSPAAPACRSTIMSQQVPPRSDK